MNHTPAPHCLVIHAGESKTLNILARWRQQKRAFETLHLRHLDAYRFYSTQHRDGRETHTMQCQNNAPVCLNHVHGLMCTAIHDLGHYFQQDTDKDTQYVVQAWYALLTWLSKQIPKQIGGLQHDQSNMHHGQWLYLKTYCAQVGMATPALFHTRHLSKEAHNQSWIGRHTFNQHYDFRPKHNPQTPLVMAPPPKNSTLIWVHMLGAQCFASTANQKPYHLPDTIAQQCHAIKTLFRADAGQFLLCHTQGQWRCYDFNTQPNWTLCHLRDAELADSIADFMYPTTDTTTVALPKQIHQHFQCAPHHLVHHPSHPPFIPSHLRPDLAAMRYACPQDT